MKKILILLFCFSLVIRFLYFPSNVYFGFDQARDAYESQSIYQNKDIKLIGPSTAAENLFHGPLYWYIIGPLYLLGGGNPIMPAAFLLVLNASGVFLIYWLGKIFINTKVGLIAGFLYAISFEQTQYAMYFGNPAPAVLTMMLFYGGLGMVIFKKSRIGLAIALAGLGLSIQFEFFLIYLFVVLIILGFVFRKDFLNVINYKIIIASGFVLLATLASFLAADIKYEFRTFKTLIKIIQDVKSGNGSFAYAAKHYFDTLLLRVHDNILAGNTLITTLVLICLLVSLVYVVVKRLNYNRQVLFLLIWFLSSIFLYIFGISLLYYSHIGIASSLILLWAYLLYIIQRQLPAAAVLIAVVIFTSNMILIVKQNAKGIRNDIYVQEGMILSRELEIIDYIYQEAEGKPIVVSALTMPLKINTTWAYLFNWYGQNKYRYLPYWSGEVAVGYPGFLPKWQSQEKDYVHFSIIESTRGVRYAFVQQFLSEEEQYGQVEEEKFFGDDWYAQLTVQKRISQGSKLQ